jgi:8-amino-7-oxononanoate synthase
MGSAGEIEGKIKSMISMDKFFAEKISARAEQGLLRTLTVEKLPVDFVSNDYLGLSRSEEVAMRIEKKHYSLGLRNGSTGSRLLAGNSEYAEHLEEKLSRLFKAESALVFNSGYNANLAVLSSIPQKGDTIIYDHLAHASIKDGARLSMATRYSFRHNDLDDLEHKLKLSKGKPFIVIESVYSMDGDESPLADICALSGKYNASIILDEAHSTGVLGPGGAGLSVSQDLQEKIDIRVYTFGKAMGTHGACVAGSTLLRTYLVNFARPFIYSTALSQHHLVSIECAFDYLSEQLHLQQILREKTHLFLLETKNITNRIASRSSIQTLLFPGVLNVKHAAIYLQQQGFDIRPIVYPTVSEGTERLRICLHTFNTTGEIKQLATALEQLGQRR